MERVSGNVPARFQRCWLSLKISTLIVAVTYLSIRSSRVVVNSTGTLNSHLVTQQVWMHGSFQLLNVPQNLEIFHTKWKQTVTVA